MSSFSVISVADLVAWLRGSYVLRPEQAAELPTLQQSFTDTKSITRELVRREWLTPFQSDFVANGRGQQLVLGQYVLLDLLGRGGMGQVFRARHVLMNRIVALKLISPEYLDQPEAVQRFRLEIQAAAQLSHPNIVAALDASQIGDTHILVMEYVEGSDLAKVLARQGKLPVYHSCVYIHQVAAGLQHAHERGLVHRDIKPHNLLLTADGQQVKILDFGLAKFVGASNVPNQRTSSGELGGTVDYLAPEQVTDFHEVDIRADVYSLGCTFYQLLTGRAPFWNIHPMAKSTFHLTKEPPAVETLRPDLPFGLPAVIRRMMSKRPEERVSDARRGGRGRLSVLRAAPRRAPATEVGVLPGLPEGLHRDATGGRPLARRAADLSSLPPADRRECTALPRLQDRARTGTGGAGRRGVGLARPTARFTP